jgi:putative iron-regulated protein
LADKVTQQIRSSVLAAEAIPTPFDRAIVQGHPGRAKIEATIKSLTAQSDQIVSAASAIGIKKLTLVQP